MFYIITAVGLIAAMGVGLWMTLKVDGELD